MALYNAEPGLGSVSEYQASGVPAIGSLIVTNGNPLTVTFTTTTKAITVWTTGAGANTISFDDGVTTVRPPRNVPMRLEVKTKQMTVLTTANLGQVFFFIAELTGVAANQCPVWDNSNSEWYS